MYLSIPKLCTLLKFAELPISHLQWRSYFLGTLWGIEWSNLHSFQVILIPWHSSWVIVITNNYHIKLLPSWIQEPMCNLAHKVKGKQGAMAQLYAPEEEPRHLGRKHDRHTENTVGKRGWPSVEPFLQGVSIHSLLSWLHCNYLVYVSVLPHHFDHLCIGLSIPVIIPSSILHKRVIFLI